MLLKAVLLSGEVAVAGLNERAFLAEGELNPVVADGCGVLARGVAEVVLGAQLFRDLVVDLGYVLVLLDLEETAAGLLGHALENFPAVDVVSAVGIVAAITASARTAASRVASAGIAASRIATAGVTSARIAATGITAPRITAAGTAASGIATAAWVAVGIALGTLLARLFDFEVDGVDDGVGALGGCYGFVDGLP